MVVLRLVLFPIEFEGSVQTLTTTSCVPSLLLRWGWPATEEVAFNVFIVLLPVHLYWTLRARKREETRNPLRNNILPREIIIRNGSSSSSRPELTSGGWCCCDSDSRDYQCYSSGFTATHYESQPSCTRYLSPTTSTVIQLVVHIIILPSAVVWWQSFLGLLCSYVMYTHMLTICSV